jgi:glutathione peroxidase-family protein
MKRIFLTGVFVITAMAILQAGLEPGDPAVEFKLKNVDDREVSLSDYSDQKGLILVFTCNPCPFAKAYEQRIIQLDTKYADQGYPVLAINSNDEELSPEDSMEKMKIRANEMKYSFPYLKDDKEVFRAYGATRTPHIFLLEKEGNEFRVAYIGSIDNNAMNASDVTERYLEKAIASLEAGEAPDPNNTKAIGCTIKAKD